MRPLAKHQYLQAALAECCHLRMSPMPMRCIVKDWLPASSAKHFPRARPGLVCRQEAGRSPLQSNAKQDTSSSDSESRDEKKLSRTLPFGRARRLDRQVLAAVLLSLLGVSITAGRASAAGIIQILTGPLFEPVRQDSPQWLRAVVWNDFKLAVVFFVAAPLLLWIWSLIEQTGREDAVKRIMFGYWQAASLLMWTVYLQIGAQPISFATAAAVQTIIPFTLWWWKDLSEEVARDTSTLARVFKGWRWIATVLSVIGAGTQMLTTQKSCTFQPDPAGVLGSPVCSAWLEPPFRYKDLLHAGVASDQLQVIGQVGTLLFVVFFLLYLTTSLPRSGRLARSNRSISYQVLARMGFYKS